MKAIISAARACVGKSAFSHSEVRSGLGWVERVSPQPFQLQALEVKALSRETLMKSCVACPLRHFPMNLRERYRIACVFEPTAGCLGKSHG